VRAAKTTLSFDARDLHVLDLALRGYLEGLDGDYDDDHVAMEAMRERLLLARRRLARPWEEQ
jgi:hypothetical protein